MSNELQNQVMTEQVEEHNQVTMPSGKQYLLNSRRLGAVHLRSIAGVLGLPTQASADELRQLIDGKLVEMDREASNVQVIIQEEIKKEECIFLVDETGVFQQTEKIYRSHQDSTDQTVEMQKELDEMDQHNSDLKNQLEELTVKLQELEDNVDQEKQ